MLNLRKRLGEKGESVAAKFLKRKGYSIIEKNFSCKLGEIDIIAEKDNTIIFTEVRTKNTDEFGTPQESITPNKIKHISRVALYYIKANKLFKRSCRFDVIAVNYANNFKKPSVEHIENAFYLSNRYRY
ncbi:YraN family protein [Candidatus Poribacteria bacterium]|nr:YraN family protein [Candidatus Poribacteria bacterium]